MFRNFRVIISLNIAKQTLISIFYDILSPKLQYTNMSLENLILKYIYPKFKLNTHIKTIINTI